MNRVPATLTFALLTFLAPPAYANPWGGSPYRNVSALSFPIVPIHGKILATLAGDRVAVSNDDVVGNLPPGSHVYRLDGARSFVSGEQIDAYADRETTPWRLFDVHAAQTFVAGLPNAGVTRLLRAGDAVPRYELVDQRGSLLRLDSFRGKVTLLSFVYTRCPPADLCPLISAKYRILQRRLDESHFHLVELTLDPRFDSPFVLANYGRRFGADARRWSLVTGEPSQVKNLLDLFGISSLEDAPAHFQHDDQLVILGKDAKIQTVIPTGSWRPEQIVAIARNDAGLASNPFERFELAAFGSFVAFCGGSISAALAILDSSVIVGGILVFGALLFWFGRRIWAQD